MKQPMVDAATLNEFLDKSEPLWTAQQIDEVVEQLDARAAASTRLFEQALSASTGANQVLWNVVPATRRLPKQDRERYEEFAKSLVWKGQKGSVLEVCQALDEWPDRPKWGLEWGTFWLHLANPAQHPWWTRWVYQPEFHTGALVLVLDDPEVIQNIHSRPALYSQIHVVQQMLTAVLDATRRLQNIPEVYRPFISLSWVYAVYMFTMSSWRMTDEFTQVLPPFPKVVKNLLGITHWGGTRIEQSQTH